MQNFRVAVLFPGQGSQEAGMGRALAEKDKETMELWKKAERASSLDLRAVYWEGEDTDMADTRALQPALTVVNLSCWLHASKRLSPACVAGHSLGEYSALAAAGVLDPLAVLELVSLRGKLMAEADPEGRGSMSALLKLTQAEAEEAVAEAKEQSEQILRIANYNTPGQFVASGTREALARLAEIVRTRKGRAVPLPVSGAFHSPLMEEASLELGKALRKASWSRAKFPVYCNASGKAALEVPELMDNLLRQMTSSVFWIETIRNQWRAGARHFVECGPKNVLSRMLTPILQEESGFEPESIRVESAYQ